MRAVAAAGKISEGTAYKYKKTDRWEERKAAEDQDSAEVYEHSKKLQNVPLSDIREDTIREMEIALNLRAKRIRESLANGEDSDGITNELQKMAAALEKSQVIEIKKQTGGVDSKNININLQKIDYAELAKIYVDAKKEGIKFDDKGHLEKVVEVVYKKDKEDDE